MARLFFGLALLAQSLWAAPIRAETAVSERTLVAYAGLAPGGAAGHLHRGERFNLQHPGVQTRCMPPQLRHLIAEIGRKLGATPVVTSAFRPGARPREGDRRRGSYHALCRAADILVPGVSPGRVFQIAKALPGRGGVGRYCHAPIVHVDLGSRREWSWSCRGGGRRRSA